ncbi:MAG: hypothetical protein ABFS23_05770 [Pseudomonadota bacterium]
MSKKSIANENCTRTGTWLWLAIALLVALMWWVSAPKTPQGTGEPAEVPAAAGVTKDEI